MAANIIYTLSDENPELQKLGCMNGILQLFEGQCFHRNRGVAGRHSYQRKLQTGRKQCSKHGSKPSIALHKSMEKKASQPATTDSSRSPDSSSWCSSSFSSADNHCRTSKPEPLSFDNRMFQETKIHGREAPKYHSNGLAEQSWESYGLQDVVKDSIHREARRVMVKTKCEEEKGRSKLSRVDSPRPSFDEREMRLRARMKMQEQPRISFDGKEQFNSPNWKQEHGRQGRTSSVVVKLMGLEMLSDPSSPVAESGLLSRFSRTDKCTEQKHFTNSNRHFRSEATTPQKNNADYWKPAVMDKSQKEPSQWKQLDDIEESYIAAPEPSRKLLNKMLEQLQSTELGKVPRASTRAFKAIEKTKKMLEAGDETRGNYNFLQKSTSPALATNLSMDSKKKSLKSPTMATEPARFRDGSISKSLPDSNKKHTSSSRGRRKLNKNQTGEDSLSLHTGSSSQPPHNLSKNTSARPLEPTQKLSTSGRIKINHSLQQNQPCLEEQHHQAVPVTDTSKITSHRGRLQIESGSATRKNWPKLQIPMQAESGVDQSEKSHQIYATSLQLKSNRGMIPYVNNDVTGKCENCMKRDASVKHAHNPKNSAPGVRAERLRVDPVEVIVQEQPSPVSVLDAMLCGNESPSPVKKISRAFKDEKQFNSEEACRASEDQNDFSHSKGLGVSFEHDPRLLLANSTLEEEVIRENTILHESEHTEHKYIHEILSLSGILRDPESRLITTLLRPSCLPLSPNLFLALEQAKASVGIMEGRGDESGQIQNSKKVRRKLILDTVNEILPQKPVFRGFFKEHIPLRPLLSGRTKGHVLLHILCSEIDSLQAHNYSNCNLDDEDYSLKNTYGEDLMHQVKELTDFQREIPGIALDIERLIFKDLIREVVGGEIAAARDSLVGIGTHVPAIRN